MKKRWKDDQTLTDGAGFPLTGISFAAGQWVFGQDPSGNNNGWKPAEDNAVPATDLLTRRLIRNAGWDEIDASGNTLRKYFNVTTLPTSGAFEDAADQAYFRFGSDATDTAAAVDYAFTGEVNEAVKYFDEVTGPDASVGFGITASNTIGRADGGNWADDGYQVGGQITIRNAKTGANDGTHVVESAQDSVDGDLVVVGTPLTNDTLDTTMVAAVDNDNAFETFLRIRDADPKGKTFAKADLAAGGETEVTSKIIKLGLANGADPFIDVADGSITSEPYSEVRLRYLPADFNLGVDSATLRAYGIIIDVGTYSRSNGVSAGSTLITSADHVLGVGEALVDYNGGTIELHDATAPDRAIHTIVGTPVDNAGSLEITIDSALTNSESNLSFTIQRSTPITASQQQIFEKVQFQLRQASDIDETNLVVVGKTADEIINFVGATDVRFGDGSPVNPNGGGSGVIVMGFDTNDTNNLFFFDNTAVSRNFPFVAAGSIVVNQGMVDDTDGEAWLYFEYTTAVTNADIDVVGPTADTYDLEGTLGTYVVGDYLLIAGFAEAANNGLFIVTVVNVSTSDYTVRKIDGTAVGGVETDQTVTVKEHPYPSPGALIVNDNAGSPIAFNITTLSTSWDFDYENNVQGGRTLDTDAAVVLVVGGLETGQLVRTPDGANTIGKSTGQVFSITSPLERNFTP